MLGARIAELDDVEKKPGRDHHEEHDGEEREDSKAHAAIVREEPAGGSVVAFNYTGCV